MDNLVQATEDILFCCLFLIILLLPMIGAFLFVWVLTLNWIAATVLSIIAQVLYIRYFW